MLGKLSSSHCCASAHTLAKSSAPSSASRSRVHPWTAAASAGTSCFGITRRVKTGGVSRAELTQTIDSCTISAVLVSRPVVSRSHASAATGYCVGGSGSASEQKSDRCARVATREATRALRRGVTRTNVAACARKTIMNCAASRVATQF